MKSRDEAMQSIADRVFDVCVIGGGASGAGCALDAQLRGLSTVLVEGEDFACATSSASTKLVHGGVRYLREAVRKLDMEQFRVVRRALQERSLMLQNAPFLAGKLELMIPCSNWREYLYYGCGMKLYDRISGRASLNTSHFLSREVSLRQMPMLAEGRERLMGSVTYADGQFDDARYNMTLVRTVWEAGGTVLNHARVASFSQNAEGKLDAAQVADTLTGNQIEIRARAFINATGPFSDAIRTMANPNAPSRLRVSKGIHLLFPLDEFEGRDALMVPKTEDGRVLFAIPWLGRLLVGTTETDATPVDEMVVLRAEAEYVLRQLNPYLRTPLELEQIVGGFAGLRPLVSSGSAQETKKLIRDHEVEVDPESGLISVLGGKWTTYRFMAEDTIDHVQRVLGQSVTECRTKHYPLSGAKGFQPDYWQSLVASYQVSEWTARHLAGKYGTHATDVLALTATRPDLAQPILEGLAPIRAEVIFAIREEMAHTIEDILARRIGIRFYGWREAIRAAPIIAAYLAEEFDWPPTKHREEIEKYVAKLNRMLELLGLPPEPVPAQTRA